MEGIRAAGLMDRTAVIIVSDHGFKQVKKQIHVNTALSEMHLEDKVYPLNEGGLALLYIDAKGAEETTAALRKQFASVDGIADVAGPERFAELGLPDPARDPQMAGLVLIPKSGYAFSGARGGPVSTTVTSPSGAHGYVNSDPEIDAIFLAAGNGIRRGVVLDRVRNVDVAPTIAQLLGVKMPADIQGRTIAGMLK
jgi:predicted AlkP superfamily pyrophosphatase or phosphodiesterase